MEEEKIIIYNEENSYDTVVVENTDEIIYDETIQIIEIDEPELFTVGTDEAFASSGGQNPQLNHALLHNRDLPDQHTIRSITGLREELDEIESLKTVESDKRGCANYYMWKDEQSTLPTQRVGYFVSIHTRDHKISICNAETEIFGVTVGSAGFVGWQEDNPRDENRYALVANTGVVKVRCWSDVVAGDYVMSSNDGTAVKTKNGHGYYVISIDNTDGTRYAIISLDSTMNQVYDLSKEVDTFNMRVDNVEIKTNAAINAATEALKNSLEPNINSALQNSQNALNNANSALDKVTDLESDLMSDMENVKIQVGFIQDSMVTEIQNAASIVVKDLVDDAIETNQEVEDLRQEVGTTKDILDEAITDVRGLSDELTTISKYLSNDYYTVDTWSADLVKETGKIFYVKDKGLYYYYNVKTDEWFSTPEPSEAGLLEVITSMRQQTDKDKSMIENLTSYSGKDYITLTEWNGYQKVDFWSQNMADPYIIYYDEHIGKYWQCEIDNLDIAWYPSVTPPRDDLEEKDTTKVYYAENTKRYYCYYDGGWHSSDASTAKLVRSIVLTRQIADENSAAIEQYLSYDGSDGDSLASIRYAVDNNTSKIESLTSYVENDYIELDELWDEAVRTKDDRANIYYAKDSDGIWKYWYWKEEDQEPCWVGSPNPSDAGLVASIVNVHQQASDNGASIAALQSWQGETNDAIASLKSSVGEDGASIEGLVMNISKYTVGEYSQAYGLTVAEAQELLRDGAIFVPSKKTSESYAKEDGTYINRSFDKEFYYVWNKNDGMWYDGGDVVFTTSYIKGSDITKYMVIEEGYTGSDGESNTDFEVGALYEWNTEKEFWKKVATLESNTLNRAISQVRQKANSIETSVSNVKGDLVAVGQKVDDMKSTYFAQTHFDNTITSIEQMSTVDTATLSMLAATGIVATELWDENGKDTNKVYYDVERKRYYYYLIDGDYHIGWQYTTNIKDYNIASKIKSAGIITAINNDMSGVSISADKINIKAEDITLEGVVTFEDLKNATENSDGTLKTVINGSNISTGVIKSANYIDLVIGEWSVEPGLNDNFLYHFDLVDDGYYKSSNGRKPDSNAICKVNFHVNCKSDVKFIARNYSAYNDANNYSYDYGMFGKLDTDVNPNESYSSSNIHHHFRYENGSNTVTITYPNVDPGNHYIWVVFKKNQVEFQDDHYMMFKFSDDMFDTYGMKIDLDDGSITSKNLEIDNNGDVLIRGTIQTTQSNFTDITIDGYSILWEDKNDSSSIYNTCAISTATGNGSTAGTLALAGGHNIIFGCRPNKRFQQGLMLQHGFDSTQQNLNKVMLYPNVSSNLGLSSNRWNQIYGVNGDFSGNFTAGSISTNGALTAGSISTSGTLTAGSLSISGTFNVGSVSTSSGTFSGALTAGSISTSGALTAKTGTFNGNIKGVNQTTTGGYVELTTDSTEGGTLYFCRNKDDSGKDNFKYGYLYIAADGHLHWYGSAGNKTLTK
jgi:predicted  nucleic acid-binding Zn-ribbon protein